MSMDIYGKTPASEAGRHFKANNYYWSQLAELCFLAAPKVAQKCTDWGLNNGDGLEAEDSKVLGEALGHPLDEDALARSLADASPEALKLLYFEWDSKEGSHLPFLMSERTEVSPGDVARAINSWRRRHEGPIIQLSNFFKDCGGFEIW